MSETTFQLTLNLYHRAYGEFLMLDGATKELFYTRLYRKG